MTRGTDFINDQEMRRFDLHHEQSNGHEIEHTASWKARLLQEAIEITTSTRNRDYGDPWENHDRTAEIWNWWIKNRFGIDLKLTDLDVCMFNILQKQSRLTNSPEHYDSWVDIAGFAGNAGVCMDHASGRIDKPLADASEIE
jgi:hypothetical protein